MLDWFWTLFSGLNGWFGGLRLVLEIFQLARLICLFILREIIFHIIIIILFVYFFFIFQMVSSVNGFRVVLDTFQMVKLDIFAIIVEFWKSLNQLFEWFWKTYMIRLVFG